MSGLIGRFLSSFLLFLIIFAFFLNGLIIRPPRYSSFRNKKTEVTLLATGDVMLGRSVMQKSLALNDFTYPFLKVTGKLREADIAFINLENPIIENCPLHTSGLKFCSLPVSVEGLVFAGIDVVTLANNHLQNFGLDGVNGTRKILGDRGILVTGLNNLEIKKINGVKFGFLGFDKSEKVFPEMREDEVELIKKSDSMVDVLLIAMHWGVEYQAKALPGVRELANELVDYGADVVIGHHPHWVQDYEFIDGKPVFYSLGNFIFDQMWSERTREGMIVELIFSNEKLDKYEIKKTYINNLGQPEFIDF